MAFVLISTAVVAATCLVSAAILLIAERYLANYGQCTIDINQGAKKLDVQGGKPLLATLMQQQVFIPSACGGRGTCAYCKVTITDGAPPIAPTELTLLTAEELKKCIRISCQVKVRNDLAIQIPEELFLVKQYTGVVERIRDLTHDIKELRIRLVEPAAIEFTPGQYVQLEAPAYGDNPEPVYRAYSISSPPDDTGHVELIIRLVPGGICTTWVFTMLKEGDEVRLNGPYSEFCLTEGDAEMVWIAGGSGMAPFWSMARHMREHGIRRPCTYFFGAVKERDLFFLDEFRALEKEMPSFRFLPALSGAENDSWAGERGLITQVVDRHVAAGANAEGYLCGSSGMIDASIKVLKAKGIPEDRIFYDKFT
ncbi:MAG: 2Fe-2S iron-sulfur cluster binding domain-containing protein [Planctomycetes bacterium]|nr:2Fe-2S iron-sulfur cluster binding domain-containing protein [Planctomycetota bacterium]